MESANERERKYDEVPRMTVPCRKLVVVCDEPRGQEGRFKKMFFLAFEYTLNLLFHGCSVLLFESGSIHVERTIEQRVNECNECTGRREGVVQSVKWIVYGVMRLEHIL